MIGSSVQSNISEGVFQAVASGNLTDKEGYLVTPTGSMSGKYPIMAIVSAATDDPLYVVEAGNTTGLPISVRPLSSWHQCRCVAAASITVGQLLTVTSAGKVTPAVNGSTIVGRALETVTVSADTPYVKVQGIPIGAYSTGTAWYDAASTTLADPHDFVLGTTTGTKIGTGTSQKLGFYNATPIVQPANTTDLRTALINLGLYATGGASPLNLNGGALTTSGASSLTGGVTTAGAFKWEVGTVAAAGSVQGDAGAVATTVAYVTAADGTKGVVLPAAAAGLVYVVYNKDANVLKLYPGSSDSINNQSANAAILVPGWSVAVCVALDATIWAVGMFSEYGKSQAAITAITAAGSAQGDGPITDAAAGTFINVTGGDGTKVVTLPVVAAGFQCELYNNSGSNLPVFPGTSGTINGGSANASVTIATYTIARLVNLDGTNWACSEQAKA